MPIKKEPPLTNRQKASEGEEKKWIGYGLPQHTLPAGHLTIECRMVEQKKTPHRHGAHRYKPMGVTETQRGEPYAHPIVLLLQARCQEKSEARSSARSSTNEYVYIEGC